VLDMIDERTTVHDGPLIYAVIGCLLMIVETVANQQPPSIEARIHSKKEVKVHALGNG
jgi:hypothetical protein